VEILESKGLDDYILEHSRNLRNDFFESLNLGGLKTEKTGMSEVQS